MIIFGVCCLLLMTIILMQPGRGQGLVGMFTSEGVQSVLGARAMDILEKITWGGVAVFFGMTIVLTLITTGHKSSVVDSVTDTPPAQEAVQQAPATATEPAAELPAGDVQTVPDETSVPETLPVNE
jgi:protein translocase SecG subunit